MPTGYTAKLMEEGQSFKEFVMDCARAFGACITLRDEPFGTKIPEKFEPSDYHTKGLKAAKKDLAKLERMSESEKTSYGEKKKAENLADQRKWLSKEELENSRLFDMESKVKQWTPPSSDHKKMKKFMLQQLDVSLHDPSYIKKNIAENEAKSPEEYFAEALEEAKRSIKYNEKELLEETDRVGDRNEWVRLLRENLKKHENE